MKAVIINKSDMRGGTAVVSYRLMHALRGAGLDVGMLVAEKLTDDPDVEQAASPIAIKRAFLKERLRVLMANRFNRQLLFKVDPASDGLSLWRHPRVKEADIVLLNWVNQGMLSLEGISRIAEERPVVWTMHDMWNATGICHHAGACGRFMEDCGDCPLLGGGASTKDMSWETHKRKGILYSKFPIRFVAVSSWLRDKCRKSSLMRNSDVTVIPNPFRPNPVSRIKKLPTERITAVVAAARLDDEVKGFPILIEALRHISGSRDDISKRIRIVLCGEIRDLSLLGTIPVEWKWLGSVPSKAMKEIYSEASLVISSSRYETLPGTLVEGQAYGALPIAFDRGGQRDIVDDGVTGILAPFGDSDTEAAENLANAIIVGVEIVLNTDPERLTSALRSNVIQKFSEEKVANRYLSLIKSCLSIK